MKKQFKSLLNGIRYFVIQSLGETFFIIVLMYLGLPYSEMLVGGEPLWEIIIGILGYNAFFKLLIFGWIYLLLFVGISAYKKDKSQFFFSLVNGLLSLLLPLAILFLRHLDLKEMANILIATVLTSALIIATVKIRENRKRVVI